MNPKIVKWERRLKLGSTAFTFDDGDVQIVERADVNTYCETIAGLSHELTRLRQSLREAYEALSIAWAHRVAITESDNEKLKSIESIVLTAQKARDGDENERT
jgi:hypothetical protein